MVSSSSPPCLDGTGAAHVSRHAPASAASSLCAVEALPHSSRLCVLCLAFWVVETVTVLDVSKYSIICPWHHDAFAVQVSWQRFTHRLPIMDQLHSRGLVKPCGRQFLQVTRTGWQIPNLTRALWAPRGSSAKPKSEQSPVLIGLQVDLFSKIQWTSSTCAVTHCGAVELGRTYTSLTSKFTMLPSVPGLIIKKRSNKVSRWMGSHGRDSMSNFRLGKLSSDGPCCTCWVSIHHASVANRPDPVWASHAAPEVVSILCIWPHTKTGSPST